MLAVIRHGHRDESRPEAVSTLTLWSGVDRLDGRVVVHDLGGADRLLRLRWPCHIVGARPVVDTAAAVIGRGFALVDVDAATHPWTLDTPAAGWCALSATARARLTAGDGSVVDRALGMAEVVVVADAAVAVARDLVAGLARAGVTATATSATGPRTGSLDVDSNAPDVRIVIGLAGEMADVDELVDRVGADGCRWLQAEVARRGAARLWIAADRPLREVWVPGLDVRGLGDLPVLVILGVDQAALARQVAAVVAELDEGQTVTVDHPSPPRPWSADEHPEPRTVALVNRGTPGFAIDVDGTIHLSLLRASTGWPSGQWIDPPRRTTPDGSSFQLQHWSHTFDYALVARAGDWREADIASAARDVQYPLTATVDAVDVVDDGGAVAGPAPVFSRWWAQGRGPRLTGHGPVAVHLHRPSGGPHARWAVTLARVPSHVDAHADAEPVDIELAVETPAVWSAAPSTPASAGPIRLAAGDHAVVALDVERPRRPAQGHHVVRVVATVRSARGDVIHRAYDENVVSVGVRTPAVWFVGVSPAVALAPGDETVAGWTLHNGTDREQWGELDLVSPWGTWELVGDHRVEVRLPPGESTSVPVRLRAPVSARPGRWWWLARAAIGPLISYSAAAELRVVSSAH